LLECAVAVSREHTDRVAVVVHDREVQLAVAGEIRRCHGKWAEVDRVVHGGAEAEQTSGFQDFEVWPVRRGS
jgi:hypothetical protein